MLENSLSFGWPHSGGPCTKYYNLYIENDVFVKGIVSRDWAGLQMGSLDRSEFRTVPLEVYF
jgi:hypothetical protein